MQRAYKWHRELCALLLRAHRGLRAHFLSIMMDIPDVPRVELGKAGCRDTLTPAATLPFGLGPGHRRRASVTPTAVRTGQVGFSALPVLAAGQNPGCADVGRKGGHLEALFLLPSPRPLWDTYYPPGIGCTLCQVAKRNCLFIIRQ